MLSPSGFPAADQGRGPDTGSLSWADMWHLTPGGGALSPFSSLQPLLNKQTVFWWIWTCDLVAKSPGRVLGLWAAQPRPSVSPLPLECL